MTVSHDYYIRPVLSLFKALTLTVIWPSYENTVTSAKGASWGLK